MNLGVAGHITAAARRGPRYDQSLNRNQRRSFKNGIWLCQNCGKAVDSDKSEHTVAQLREWKRWAEAEAKGSLGVTHSNSHFELLPEDQTLYINVRRLDELAQRNHVYLLYPSMRPNTRLLDLEGSLASFVMGKERELKDLLPRALPIASLESKRGRQAAVGHLVHFLGTFRPKNSPRIKSDGLVPIVHPVGDLKKDHHVYTRLGSVRFVLPLDSLWFASESSVTFFREPYCIPLRGLARVHLASDGVVIASPLWLALPTGPKAPRSGIEPRIG